MLFSCIPLFFDAMDGLIDVVVVVVVVVVVIDGHVGRLAWNGAVQSFRVGGKCLLMD